METVYNNAVLLWTPNLGSHRSSACENLVALDKWLSHSKSHVKLGDNNITLIRLLTLVSYVCEEFNPIVVAIITTNNKSHKQSGGGGALKNI